MASFVERFGPRALVTGAAEGIGAAFARALASRGLDLLLLDWQEEKLGALAAELRRGGRDVRTVAVDLRRPDLLAFLGPLPSDLGLLVSSAGAAVTGPFAANDPSAELGVLDLNCRAPLLLLRAALPALLAQRRGGVVLVASTVAINGAPGLAHYAATKAWTLALADSLAVELAGSGVAVQALLPGMTRTPALARSMDVDALRLPPMEPEAVVDACLRGLGRRTVVVPGLVNRLSTFLSRRVLPRGLRHRLLANRSVRPLRVVPGEDPRGGA